MVVPTLCPRCDAPAADRGGERVLEQCGQCSLQLRWCGSCHAVAGPFDRFCGYCGFELIQGGRRSPLWRMWALVALLPLVAGLGYGLYATLTPAAAGILHRAQRPHRVAPTPAAQSRSPALGVRYSGPPGWTVVDYTVGPSPEPALVLSRDAADQAAAAAAVGDLAQVDQPRSSLIAVARRPLDVTPVADPGDPVAALTSSVAPLAGTPPAGLKVDVVRPVHALTVGGRPAAEVELRLERDDGVAYLRRDVVYAPQGQAPAMCQVDALMPAAEWPAAETGAVSKVVGSLGFS